MSRAPWLIRLARWVLRHELENWRLREENATLQLTVCRAMLATTMRERDKFETTLDEVSRELAKVRRCRRRERQQLRTWITRCGRVQANWN